MERNINESFIWAFPGWLKKTHSSTAFIFNSQLCAPVTEYLHYATLFLAAVKPSSENWSSGRPYSPSAVGRSVCTMVPKAPRALLPNLACAGRISPNAMLSLGIWLFCLRDILSWDRWNVNDLQGGGDWIEFSTVWCFSPFYLWVPGFTFVFPDTRLFKCSLSFKDSVCVGLRMLACPSQNSVSSFHFAARSCQASVLLGSEACLGP